MAPVGGGNWEDEFRASRNFGAGITACTDLCYFRRVPFQELTKLDALKVR